MTLLFVSYFNDLVYWYLTYYFFIIIGNSYGCDQNNTCCIGCGPQEQFYGCADIAISPASGYSATDNVNHATSYHVQNFSWCLIYILVIQIMINHLYVWTEIHFSTPCKTLILIRIWYSKTNYFYYNMYIYIDLSVMLTTFVFVIKPVAHHSIFDDRTCFVLYYVRYRSSSVIIFIAMYFGYVFRIDTE